MSILKTIPEKESKLGDEFNIEHPRMYQNTPTGREQAMLLLTDNPEIMVTIANSGGATWPSKLEIQRWLMDELLIRKGFEITPEVTMDELRLSRIAEMSESEARETYDRLIETH